MMSLLKPPTHRKVSSYVYPSFSEKEFETRHKRIFPLDGEPVVASILVLPDRAARSIVEVRARNAIEVTVQKIKELSLSTGKIGIVEPDVLISIPVNHWDTLRSEFPQADFEFVTEDFWKLRWVKTPEEIQALQNAAQLSDIGTEAIARAAEPGVSEGSLYGAYYDAVFSSGGEPGFPGIGSTSMQNPDASMCRVHPMERTLQKGDILLLELGPLYMGYEAQNQRSIALGPLPGDYQEMYSVALEAWNVVTEALQPGNTHEDIVKAGQIIKKAGFRWFSPLVHWMHGGSPRDGSYIGHPNPKLSQVPVTLVKDLCATVEVTVSNEELTKGVMLGDTFHITEKGPRRLQSYPESPEMLIL
jgi:Xaa-Pro aminopeptidase